MFIFKPVNQKKKKVATGKVYEMVCLDTAYLLKTENLLLKIL